VTVDVLTQVPDDPSGPPIVFVHGAWHANWCWADTFMPYFVDHGHPVHAPSLRGHGESPSSRSLGWVRGRDYVADVASVVDSLDQAPVVVGHSMGGYVVQKLIEERPVRGAVLLASVPPRGVFDVTQRIARTNPKLFLELNLKRSLFPLVNSEERVRAELFSAATPDAVVAATAARLQDESYLAFLDMLAFDLPRPSKVNSPVMVLGATEDAIFPPKQVEATAAAYGTKADFVEAGHNVMMEAAWQEAAGKINSWIKTLP
jgi:pimeloyl-ACP methyl ester carboxylesterase